mmetsp:Transcript_59237/g.105270  ORF Transcript_59237/g.105270 Transcript_59237/m.105270 type:complete len:184 (-) Transcript_59237:110-661(-)
MLLTSSDVLQTRCHGRPGERRGVHRFSNSLRRLRTHPRLSQDDSEKSTKPRPVWTPGATRPQGSTPIRRSMSLSAVPAAVTSYVRDRDASATPMKSLSSLPQQIDQAGLGGVEDELSKPAEDLKDTLEETEDLELPGQILAETLSQEGEDSGRRKARTNKRVHFSKECKEPKPQSLIDMLSLV